MTRRISLLFIDSVANIAFESQRLFEILGLR
jgi:hypothetical protein